MAAEPSSAAIDRYMSEDVRAILEDRFWIAVEEISTLEAVSVDGSRLSAHFVGAPPDQHVMLVAKNATTFLGIGMQGTTLVFTVEGDKATGFAMTPAQGNPAKYTRVEGK